MEKREEGERKGKCPSSGSQADSVPDSIPGSLKSSPKYL